MSELIHARLLEHLIKLHLGRVAEQLDALLSDAARKQPTYLDFLDQVLCEEIGSKQRKRVAMGIQIAVCTWFHCVGALRKITGATNVGMSYSSWKQWYESSQRR